MFEFAPMTERIQRVRAKRDVFTGGKYMTINSERTKIYTDYYKEHENEYPLLKRSGALLEWAAKKKCNVFDDDILVGTPGPDERCLSPYVEWNCRWIPSIVDDTDENFKKAWQSHDSIYMSDEQRQIFREAYDFWKDRTIAKMVEGAITEDFWDASGNGCLLGSGKRDPFFFGVSGMPQGHYIANFDKAINVGFGEVKRQAQAKLDAMKGRIYGNDAKPHIFYYSVIRVCEAAMVLSKRYADACREKAVWTKDEKRQAELYKMADSLDWIMENPARTYWEGLQAAIFYQIILSTDAQQHGQSIGRIDKYTGHLLKKQLEEGTITQEEAQEMTDAFILRLSDIIVLPGFSMNNQRIIEIMFETESDELDSELRALGYLAKLDDVSIHCFRQVTVFANSREDRMRLRAYRYLDAALTQVFTAAEEPDPYVLNSQFIDMTGLSDVTKAVIVYIDKHYSEQFTLDDMGEELGYNKSYLCTVFKRDTESTINDYLNLVRITHFAEYYSFQSEDIAKICSYCGFTSASHFNRTFKKFLGTSPRSYKQIRFSHFNTDTLTRDMKDREDSYSKLRGILERTCAPAARLDVAVFSENETEET